jgi:hypothetical protein
MRTVLSLAAATSLLIGQAATAYAQQAGTPGGVTSGPSVGGAAQLGTSPNARLGSTPSSAAQFGSSPSSAAGSAPGQQLQPNGTVPGEPAVSNNAPNGTTPGEPAVSNSTAGTSGNAPARNSNGQVIGGGALITGPGNVVEQRDRVIKHENDITTGRADHGGCTTQTYRVPSEATGDLTSVGVTRC